MLVSILVHRAAARKWQMDKFAGGSSIDRLMTHTIGDHAWVTTRYNVRWQLLLPSQHKLGCSLTTVTVAER